jgi:Na+/H+-dicarboxylate symporter
MSIVAVFPARVAGLYKSRFAQVVVGLLLGIAVGVLTPDFAIGLKFFSDAFLKLITMIVAPIVFCVVVHGIAGAGDLKKVGRVGVKALVYFELMTTVALIVGIALAFLVGPGHGMNVDPSTLDPKMLNTHADNVHRLQGGGVGGFVLNIIPTTSFDALARNDVLQVLCFAVLFGVSLSLVGDVGKPVTAMIERISTVLFKMMGLIVRLAPLGVLGAVGYTVGQYGVGSLRQLISLVMLYYASVAFFVLVVLGSIMRVAGLNIFKFLAYLREELTIVLGTASSDAVLPQIMHKLERMGIDKSVVGLATVLDLFDPGGRVPCPGDEYAAVDRRPIARFGSLARYLERRTWGARLGDCHPRRDPQRCAEYPRDRPGAGPFGRLVYRHGPCARQFDWQLRGHSRCRRLGKRNQSTAGRACARQRRHRRGKSRLMPRPAPFNTRGSRRFAWWRQSQSPCSEFPQCLAQSGLGIGVAYQATALQRRHQPLADLVDEAAAGPLERRAD